MSFKQSYVVYMTSTGAGIAVGTDVAITSIIRQSDVAGTLTLKANSVTLLTMSADRQANFAVPICVRGAVTATASAGGGFLIGYVDL